MTILSHYRSVSGLVVISLFFSSFLLSGCSKPWVIRSKPLFGENLDKFPAVVLSTQKPHSHDYTFDWDKNTIGGVKLSEFPPAAKYWRLNLFGFKDGKLIGTLKNCRSLSLKTDRTEYFTGLDFDILMRADLDLGDDPKCETNAETLSVNVLLHDE